MKQGIEHFPEQTQEELTVLLEEIRHHIPACDMIILYGSYARDKYVIWDEREENGIHTSYQSDFDILVVVSVSNYKVTENTLRKKVTEGYNARIGKKYQHITPPQFIVENIKSLNDNLKKTNYFFTDIIREGILLFDNGQFQLSEPSNLNFSEIREIAAREYEMYSESAEDYLELLMQLRYVTKPLKDAVCKNRAFTLHQVCEKCYYAILLVYTNYKPKNHRLNELASMAKSFSRKLITVFPMNSDFEKECYGLLSAAYVDGRYTRDFKITLKQLLYLLDRVEYLYDIMEELCLKRLRYYDQMIAEESNTVELYPALPDFSSNVAELDSITNSVSDTDRIKNI